MYLVMQPFIWNQILDLNQLKRWMQLYNWDAEQEWEPPCGWSAGLPMRKWVGTRIWHTHTRTLQQDKVDCASSQILAILALHWHLCIFCGWTALPWQRSWLCNLHHLIPSLPVTSWMSTLGIVVQTYNQCGNWLTYKQVLAQYHFEAGIIQ